MFVCVSVFGECSSASADARIGSLPCFGSGLDVWHGNVPRRVLHTLHLGAIAGNAPAGLNSWRLLLMNLD